MEINRDTHVAILFGMTLQNSIDGGTYGYAIIVALCGHGFAYDVISN